MSEHLQFAFLQAAGRGLRLTLAARPMLLPFLVLLLPAAYYSLDERRCLSAVGLHQPANFPLLLLQLDGLGLFVL